MYLTENRLSRNEMWYVADDHNYMRQIYSKEFLDSNFNQSVIDTTLMFNELASKFHKPTKIVTLKV